MTTAPGPTGPLPRPWHRVSWLTVTGRFMYAVTDDAAAATSLETTLKCAPGVLVKPGSVRTDAWSDWSDTDRPQQET